MTTSHAESTPEPPTVSLTSSRSPDETESGRSTQLSAAASFFAAKLRHETDPSDVAVARAAGEQLLLLDVRNEVAWEQGHIPGAVHLPGVEILDRIDELPPADDHPRLVVYCWGPACNGSAKAALALTQAGYSNVKEMIGGFECWAREGLAVVSADGRSRRPIDELTAPVASKVPSDV